MPSRRSTRCSWNPAGREPRFTVWPRRSFWLTAGRMRRACELTGQPLCWSRVRLRLLQSPARACDNAAKYGSLSAAGGHVEISWTVTADGRLSLRWIESGGPTATPPTHRGFGTRIMENMIGQLRGEGAVLIGATRALACESLCRFIGGRHVRAHRPVIHSDELLGPIPVNRDRPYAQRCGRTRVRVSTARPGRGFTMLPGCSPERPCSHNRLSPHLRSPCRPLSVACPRPKRTFLAPGVGARSRTRPVATRHECVAQHWPPVPPRGHCECRMEVFVSLRGFSTAQ